MKKLTFKRIHFLGIGGISQSALAKILKEKGYFVSGSDRVESEVVFRLRADGINITINGISSFIETAEAIVVSAAIGEDDPELALAKSLNKPIFSRAEMLGIVANAHKHVISVAGSHGKTTTTGMLAQIFIEAGLNPTVHIGGDLPSIRGNVRVGGGEYFITEACEYVDSFLTLKSDVSIILNVQSDHLDYFKNLENIQKSFTKFAGHTKKGGLVVYSADDENIKIRANRRIVGFSFKGKGVLEARNIKEYERGKYKFDCFILGCRLFKVKLGVYGKHNVSNALAAISTALEFGIDEKVIADALNEFQGVKRRFEFCGEVEGVKIIHDYAHHPTELKATIELARAVTKGDIYAVFQPHTYSRTMLLLDEFRTCFTGVREALIYKVYPARESPSDGVDEKCLAREVALSGQTAFSFDAYKEMKTHLKAKLKEGDLLLILGAGDIESFVKYFKN